MAVHAQWEFRLEIEGLGIEAVSHPDMEQTLSASTESGRVRVCGLKRDGLGFSEKVDMMRASTEGKGFTARIVDRQVDNIWTRWFTHEPVATTYLSQDMNKTTATMWVVDSSSLSVGDIIHCGTEAMKIAAKPATNGLTVIRAYYGSIAQAHYTDDGAKLSMPAVTKTYPLTLEGRRARLYRYRVGTDSLTGNGTQIYTGFVSRDAKLNQNLAEWAISIDSPYALFKQDLGGALEDEIPPRGIYYPPQAPLKINIREWSSDSFLSTPHPYVLDEIKLEISGFFETQQDFCDEINDQLDTNTTDAGATGVSGWNAGSIIAVSDGSSGWHFEWEIGSTERLLTFVMDHIIEGRFNTTNQSAEYPGNITSLTGVTDTTLLVYPSASGDKYMAGAGTVPRGGFGGGALPHAGGYDGAYLYFGSSVELDTESHSIVIVTPDDVEISVQIDTFNSANRWAAVSLSDLPDDVYWFTGSDTLELKLSRNFLGTTTRHGSLATLRDKLVALGPDEANLGSVPFFTHRDLANWTSEVNRAIGGAWYLSKRVYEASASIETRELFEHELRMLGMFMAQDATGKIGVKRMRVPGPTDFSSIDLTESNIITSGVGFPQWERNTLGSLNTVTIKTGWNHKEEEHVGTTYTVRDFTAVASRKALKMLEIAPRSRWALNAGARVRLGSFGTRQRFTYEDAVRIATTPLAIFGRPYSTITLTVSGADGQDMVTTALLGEFLTVTHSWLPNPSDGTRGISSQPAVIIGRDWDLANGRGTLTLLTLRANRAGYAPSLWLNGTPSNVSGNTYDCTVKYTDPANTALWSTVRSPEERARLGITGVESGDDIGSNRIQASDELELIDFDSLSPSVQTCSVVQWNSSTSIRVTFDSSPTFSGEQYFRFASADAAVSTQQLYAYWSDDDGNVNFATPAEASVFG